MEKINEADLVKNTISEVFAENGQLYNGTFYSQKNRKQKPKPATSDQYHDFVHRYMISRLSAIFDNESEWHIPQIDIKTGDVFSMPLFTVHGQHPKGFSIVYTDPEGKPILWDSPDFGNIPFTRLRFAPGLEKRNQETGKSQKYDVLKGSKTYTYFPGIVKYFHGQADNITTIFITEGELKAFAASKAGIPTLGVSGIFNFGKTEKDQEGKTVDCHFLEDLLHFLKSLKNLENIVFLHDADCREPGSEPGQREKNFYASIKNFKMAGINFSEDVNLFYAHINEDLPKGIDDLLIENQDHADEITEAAFSLVSSDYFQFFNLKTSKISDLRDYFLKKKTNEEDDSAWKFLWPSGLKDSKSFDRDNLEKMVFQWRFIQHDNCYWTAMIDNVNHTVSFYQISNFIVRPLFLIISKTNGKRLLEMVNQSKEKIIGDIRSEHMVGLVDFKKFCEPKGNFVFWGTGDHFVRIKRKIYEDTKQALEVSVLGLQPDTEYFAYSNGILKGNDFFEIDQYGMVQIEKRSYFLPPLSQIYRDEYELYENEKKIRYIKSDTTFNQWADLFCTTYGDNGKIALLVYAASLFRDIIFKNLFFVPLLFIYGKSRSGKSVFARSLMHTTGEPRNPFMLNAGTPAAFSRTFSVMRNGFIWLDEYRDSIDEKRKQDIRSSYDGSLHTKAEWSHGSSGNNRTLQTPVYAVPIITGEHLPTSDNALFSRCILLILHQTVFNEEEKERFSKLRQMEDQGISCLSANLLSHRSKVKSEFLETYASIQKQFTKKIGGKVDDRMINNMTVLAAIFKILKPHVSFPFDWDNLEKIMIDYVSLQNGLVVESSTSNKFWETFSFLVANKQLEEGRDFKIQIGKEKLSTKKGDIDLPEKVLYLAINNIYPKYKEALSRQNDKSALDKASLIHYISNDSYGFLGIGRAVRFYKKEERWDEGKRQEIKKYKVTTAYAFDLDVLQNSEIGLDLNIYDDDTDKKAEKDPNYDTDKDTNYDKPDF